MSIKISYVIPHYKGIDLLRGCLHALKGQTYRPASQEVIVVDDCSQDGSGDWLRAHHPEVRLERNERNLGFARTVNRGLKIARGDWVVLVNNDVQLTPGSVQAASRWFADQGKGSVAFNILNLRAPDLVDSAGDVFTIAGYAQKRYEGLPVSGNPALAGPVFSACGAAAAYRAAALKEVGYFDESLEAYYEDVDLGIRLRLAGYECIFEPEARAFHRCGGTYGTQSLAAKSIFLNSRNAEKVFFKFFPGVFSFSHFIRHLVVLSIFLVAKIPAGRYWWYFLQGKMAALHWALTASSRRWQGQGPAHKDLVLGALESRWLGAHVPTWRRKARRFFRRR